MSTIYIRTLKRAEHTVFCVSDGQKFYRDSQFDNRMVPFSSGQQIKRSVMESLSMALNEVPSPITFYTNVKKSAKTKNLEFDGEGVAFGTCDPTNSDQLLGGWMKALKGGDSKVIKRRSPLSISAMRGLHPLLAGIEVETGTFDRKDRGNNIVVVKDESGRVLTEDELVEFLDNRESQVSLTSKYLKPQRRATGLFVQDMAIDMRRLFCVSLNKLEPEITEETEAKLREEGWKETQTVFGTCLVAPKPVREKLIPALAHAIVNWTITSNQARTFSLMETLAISVSDNANRIAGSIRAKLKEEYENRAEPIIEEDMKGVETFVSLAASGYIRTKKESVDAMDNAQQALINQMMAFDYENQLN
ncbi:CRISPR-associated protein Cas7 [Labilibaculum manganireducens]|uniref:CRISPR-associated protein Cas7 n=1 Tax=Labilibaculum manganireducens TaxID=1940525 RepID=A0A2N3IC04_9BACT|nr:CRISPR-associated protein Cas7 [Labilibaculum manganireducens]PKQ67783.1 CRISPR-associated protein Cas7 [Labilibaculum manganireducens]